MAIIVRLDVMLALRKAKSKDLAAFVGITETNLSLLKSGRVKGIRFETLERIYPTAGLREHVVGEPITVSWEADPNFLGAFKGALPGHYRYNHRMYAHFLQRDLRPAERGMFLAGDDVSWTPGWAEGAVQTRIDPQNF